MKEALVTLGSRYGGHFLYVVCDSERCKLGSDQPVASIMEAFEAPIIFDLSEDRLRFYRPHTSMVHSAFARQHFLGFIPI